jgi:hypothetical protein
LDHASAHWCPEQTAWYCLLCFCCAWWRPYMIL